MFEKKTCERCGKQYSIRTISENKGRHYCKDCVKKCLVCGNKLPMAHWFGQPCSVTQGFLGNVFTQSMERQQKPWIGSGMCMDCYNNKIRQEEEEDQILREARLAHAKEILETPTVWECQYCKTVNRGRFCSNCGSPRRKQQKRKPPTTETTVTFTPVQEDESQPQWYRDAMKEHKT